MGKASARPGPDGASNHTIRLIPGPGPGLALLDGSDERGVGRMMNADLLWWLGVFLSLGVVAGVAWIFES